MRLTKTILCMALVAIIGISTSHAQDQQKEIENPMVYSLIGIHNITQDFILGTAEMMDEEMYAYRPSVNVKSAGQILAHITNAQFGVCSTAAGEDNPAKGNYEEIATTRDEIKTALKESFDYCQKIYASMTDEKGMEIKPFFGGDRNQDMTVHAILSFNSTHNYEHYGNLVTYLRINGLVPPSSSS